MSGAPSASRRPERERLAAVLRGQVRQPGEITAGDHRPAQAGAAGQAIQPGHGVAVLIVGVRQVGHGVVDVGCPHRVDPHSRCLDLGQLDASTQDDPGQAHSAGGRPEEPGFARRRDATHAAVRQQQVEPRDMPCEAARQVMVLAMHVRGDGAADRHLTSTWRHRHEPAMRQPRDHKLLQADARFAGHQAADGVQVADPVQSGRHDHHAAIVLRGVVVTAAKAPGDHAPSRVRPAAGQ